jgi:hypothetical protein
MKIFPLYTCKINFIGVHFRLFLFQRVGRMGDGANAIGTNSIRPYEGANSTVCDRAIRGGANAIRPYGREVFLRKLQKISDLISLKIESAN